MKIDRLIGILSILLQQENITAPVLAEKFEVSKRTINRDIECLCQAGIPIVTRQGNNGGISIMDGYKIDKTLLTKRDLQSIMVGLKGLDSISGDNAYRQLMEKLSVSDDEILHSNEHIMIDLTSWYKTSLVPKIELIQNAVNNREKIQFTYFSPRGETKRTVDPYQLIFKWSSWYIWAYCDDKGEFRLFKLNRMDEIQEVREKYVERPMPYPELSTDKMFPPKYQVRIRFKESAKWRLIEEFGKETFVTQKDGTLLFSFGFEDTANLFEWLMSFGNQAELLEPVELRKQLCGMAKDFLKIYQET